MTTLAFRRLEPEPTVAAAAVALVGSGAVAAAAGALGGGLTLGLLGAATASAGLMILLVTGWIDGFVLLIVTLAAPAPFASESLRLAPAAAASAALILAWTLRAALVRPSIELDVRPRVAIAALLGAVLLSAAFAGDAGSAAREVVNWTILLSLLAIAATEIRRDPRRAEVLARAIAVVMAIGGTLAVLQGIGVLPSGFRWGSTFNRATLGFGWPNELGMFMAVGLPFSVHATRSAITVSARGLAWFGVVAAIGGLAASFSRGSWVAVSAATFALLLRGERRFVFGAWVGILVGALCIDAVSGGALTGRFTSIDSQFAVGQRLALMMTGFLMFRANPLLGVGPGGFGASLEEYGPRVSLLWDYVGSAHNLYVHTAAETGLVGLAALLFFLATCWMAAFRAAGTTSARASAMDRHIDASLRRAVLWSFTTACLVGLFEWSFAHGVGQLIVLVAAMALALAAEKAP
jgi:O-antigen ligase